MLQVDPRCQDVTASAAELVAVPVFAQLDPGPGCAEILDALGVPLATVLKTRSFSGKPGETLAVPTLGRLQAATVLLVGLGDRDKVSAVVLRRAAAAVVRAAGTATLAATTLPQVAADHFEGAQAVTEGAMLAAYRFDRYKSKDDEDEPASLRSLEILLPAGTDEQAAEDAAAVGRARARATNLARDLGNEPANNLHPLDLAAAARRAVSGRNVDIRVLDVDELRAGGYGGIVGVGQGAAHPPCLVELVYRPENPVGRVALVGKGITFDTGGLALKPNDSMATMKTDMSGAGAVVGVMSVLGELGVRLEVHAYLPLAENMPSSTAMRPSDVLTMRNGKTVEVLNTDAEGRLVLADAFTQALECAPDALVDLATLTGACVVALGTKYTGLMGNNRELVAEVLDAAGAAGEPTWELPLPDEYERELRSEVADYKNIGSRWGGALTAGLFLRAFVGDCPWVHLDIAGPARSESVEDITPRGSTGVGVRTVLTWLQQRSEAAVTS